MDSENVVIEAKQTAWNVDIQPLVKQIIDLADLHGIPMMIVGAIEDPADDLGELITRGGMLANSLREVALLRQGANGIIMDALNGAVAPEDDDDGE